MLESDPSGRTASNELPYEERTISEFERQLPFTDLDFRTVVETLRTRTQREITDTGELQEIWSTLGIGTDPNLSFFAELFRRNDGKISRNNLLLGILLTGEASLQVKAEWLFDSSSSTQLLSQAEVETLIRQILCVSCEVLPKLATGDGPDYLAPSQMSAYLAPVSLAQASLAEQLSAWMMTDTQISRTDFILRLCNPRGDCSSLLTSSGTRTTCLRLLQTRTS